MHEEILREIGLSPNEARIYEVMIQLGEASVQAISNKSGVHRRNVYDSLKKLMEKGLASEAILKNEKHFRATNPDRLLGIIKEKEDKLSKILPDMKTKFQTLTSEEQAYIYKGIQGFRNYMQDILDVGKDVYCIGAKGGWFDARLKTFRFRFYQELKKKKIKCYHLFDAEMSEQQQNTEGPVPLHTHEARFLEKKYSTKSAIDILDDRVITFTGLNINSLDDDITIFVLISKKLADDYKKWFQLMWDASKPIKKTKNKKKTNNY